MKSMRFGEGLHISQVMELHDLVNVNHYAGYVHLDLANWVTFILTFGTVTSNATSDNLTVTVQSASINSTAVGTCVDFTYRLLSTLAGTNTAIAATAGTSDGVVLTSSDLVNAVLLIDVDPSVIAAKGETQDWCAVWMDPGSSLAIYGTALAVIEPRYPGATTQSST